MGLNLRLHFRVFMHVSCSSSTAARRPMQSVNCSYHYHSYAKKFKRSKNYEDSSAFPTHLLLANTRVFNRATHDRFRTFNTSAAKAPAALAVANLENWFRKTTNELWVLRKWASVQDKNKLTSCNAKCWGKPYFTVSSVYSPSSQFCLSRWPNRSGVTREKFARFLEFLIHRRER